MNDKARKRKSRVCLCPLALGNQMNGVEWGRVGLSRVEKSGVEWGGVEWGGVEKGRGTDRA